MRETARACIRTLRPRIVVNGTRISRVQVFVNGRLRKTVLVAPLQRTIVPRLKLRPGRHHIRLRVTYQLGSGTAPVNLARTLKICAKPQPRFTG